MQLLQARGVQAHVQLRRPLHLWRIVRWLRKRHLGLNWETLIRRFLPGWKIAVGQIELFRPPEVAVTRYRYRGTRIPTPWTSPATEPAATPA